MKELETLKITNQKGKEIDIKVVTILKKPDNSKSFKVVSNITCNFLFVII